MSNDTVSVKIVGDASSGVDAAAKMAKAMAEAAAIMKSKMGEIQATFRDAFGGVGNSATSAQAKIKASADGTVRDSDRAAAAVMRGARQQQDATRKAAEGITRDQDAIRGKLRELATVIGVAFTGRELIGLTDAYTRLQNQLKVAGLEGQGLASVQERLFAVAQKYGVSLESLAGLYGRTSQGSKELGASEEQLLKFTSGVAAALKVQGGSAESTAGAIMQLTQALGGSIVRAEEFNSINEGARPILQAVADGIDRFGGSVAKLRAEVTDGKVTSAEFFQAFLKGSGDLETKAAKAVLTTSGAFQTLNNALTVYFGEASKTNGVSAALGIAIGKLADNLDIVIPAVAVIATSLGVGYVTSAVAARVATLSLGEAMLGAFGGPVGIAISAIIIAIGAFIGSANSATKATNDLGNVSAATATAIAKLNNILSQDPSAKVAGDAQALASARIAQANATYQAASAEIALRKAQASARLKDLDDGTVTETVDRGRAGKQKVQTTYGNRALSLQRGIARDAVSSADSEQAALDLAMANAKKQIASPPARPGVGTTAKPAVQSASNAAAGGSDRISGWEQQLDAQRVAFAKMKDQQGSFEDFSKQSELQYWSAILGRTDLSNRERQQIDKRATSLRLQLRKDEFDAQIAMLGKEMEAAEGNMTERLRLANQVAQQIGQKFGQQSRQYQAAEEQVLQVAKEAADQQRQIADSLTQHQEALALTQIDIAEAAAVHAVEMGRTTSAQLIQQEQRFEAQRLAVKQKALQAQLKATDPTKDPVRYRAILNQILELEQQFEAKRQKLAAKAESDATKTKRAGIASVSSSWSQALAKMATGQATFADTIKSLWQGLADVITNVLAGIIERYLTQWLTSLIIGKAAGSTKNVAEVMGLAAVAGAAAWASTAAIPIIGPGLAPAAAAASYAGAAAFAPLASFEVGAWDIPGTMTAMLHQGEMVVPRTFAQDFREKGTMGGSRESGPNVEVHVHAIDTRSGAKFLIENKIAVAEAVRKAVRDGYRPGQR